MFEVFVIVWRDIITSHFTTTSTKEDFRYSFTFPELEPLYLEWAGLQIELQPFLISDFYSFHILGYRKCYNWTLLPEQWGSEGIGLKSCSIEIVSVIIWCLGIYCPTTHVWMLIGTRGRWLHQTNSSRNCSPSPRNSAIMLPGACYNVLMMMIRMGLHFEWPKLVDNSYLPLY